MYKSDCKGRNSSLFFFTDGCHNCGPFSNAQHVLEELRQYLEVTVFVGCGYINRDNMLEMARITEGSFIQLSSFTDFEQTLNDFGESVGDLQPSVLVEMNENDKNICSICEYVIKVLKFQSFLRKSVAISNNLCYYIDITTA